MTIPTFIAIVDEAGNQEPCVKLSDHEREIAKRDALLNMYRATLRDHGWCWIRPEWEGRAAVDMRCDLCKRTDALLEGK